MGKKLTKDIFVEKARKVHGDKYDYSKVNYVNSATKVCIICPEHGEFWQTPSVHIRGNGCYKCGIVKSRKGRITTEQFIKKAREIHGDKYDYSKVEYKTARDKICIICPEHGEFWQTPNSHLNKNGCPVCANNTLFTTEQFIKKAREIHGNKYDYSKTNYINAHTKVCIICPEHGEFWQLPLSHINHKSGCPNCCKNRLLTTEEWIRKAREIHGDKYDYSKVEYINQHTKVCIICPEHGEFWQLPNNHINKINHRGCYKCNSAGNTNLVYKIENILTENNIHYNREQGFEWLKGKGKMFLDFYVPKYNVAIECHGIQHFESVKLFGGDESFKKLKERDELKYKLCKEHGIKIFYFANKEYDYFEKVYDNEKKLISEICKK